jgi:hypothetical protein
MPPRTGAAWRFRRSAIGLLAALLCLGLTVRAAPPVAAVPTCDALCNRVRAELGNFTGWLTRYNVKGYVGEVGWPDAHIGDPLDPARWNSVAEQWFAAADQANLWVTAWNAKDRSPYDRLAIYRNGLGTTTLGEASTQAPTVEAHKSTPAFERGVNALGGDRAAPTQDATSTFSNASPGTFDQDYWYGNPASFSYLRSRGVNVIRLPIRWERIQPQLNEALDPTELQRVVAAVTAAGAAGLRVVLDLHNYGHYYRWNGVAGVPAALGSTGLPTSAFVDVWKRLSSALRTSPDVIAYDLMNEPHALEPTSRLTAARVWELASQAAVNAIRSNADSHLIMVPGYAWSGAQVWSQTHPRPWIKDALKQVRYEAHHYWDSDHSGHYLSSYSAEVTTAAAQGYPSS